MKKTLANLPGILALLVAFGSVAYAGSYTPPPSPGYPSGNNNVDAPINVGSSNQTKSGGILTLMGDLTVNGYLLANSGITVGTATTAPATGGIHASGDICTDAGGGKCLSNLPTAGPVSTGLYGSCIQTTNTNNGPTCTAYNPSSCTSGNWGCSCAAGYTIVETGYSVTSSSVNTSKTRYYSCYKN